MLLIMNFNVLGYSLFTLLIVVVILVVGQLCYKNGNIYVAALIPDRKDLCEHINKILLVGYYLVNIGYGTMTFIQWETILSVQQLVETLAIKVAWILAILCFLHYLNIYLLTKTIHKFI
ncbi:hypothetical protein ACJVDH_03785 [Pedobacter sp. AW1-32]|uniref:hypothetical protein n=1 Tax=Pedobacter sp. AW1-32 TaxID=3383026 RepID=UPI003FF0510B